jgi:leucine dehydrogenase
VYQGMRAAATAVFGNDSLKGRTIAIQGFGNVATSLSNYLLEAEATLVVTDIDEAARARAERLRGVRVVEPEAIFDQECDIFAPCALGGALNEATIPRLRCRIVCGAANNQLATDEDDNRLVGRDILYAPDYIVNSGGVINVYYEHGRTYNRDAAMAKTAQIFDTMTRVIELSQEQGITTAEAADALAQARIAAVSAARTI